MPEFRVSAMAVVLRGPGARHLGLLALRSASGLGLPVLRPGRPAPTAFNRAGEKLQATGGELPRVSHGVVPDAGTGSLSPLVREEGLGHPLRVRCQSAGQAASAGQGAGWPPGPAAMAGSQLVPWTTMQ